MRRCAVLFVASLCVVSSGWPQQPGYPLPQPPGGQTGPGPVQPPPLPPPQPPQPQPPPPQPPAQVQYYIEENGRPTGPFSLEQMQQRIRAGQLQQTALVWKTGMATWVEARTLGELNVVQAPPPAIPPEARLKQFMLGVWTAEVHNPTTGGMTRTTARYNADGSFSGTQMISMMNSPGFTTPMRGTWKLTAISDKEFVLSINQAGEFMPFSATFVIMDQNTMQHKDEGYMARRVGQ